MTARVSFRQSDLTRALRAVKKSGGGYAVRVENGVIHLLPSESSEPLSEADDIERRMQEAFGK